MSHDAETPKQQDAEALKRESAPVAGLIETALLALRNAGDFLAATPAVWPATSTIPPAMAQLALACRLLNAQQVKDAAQAWDLAAESPTPAQIELITNLLGALSLIADVPQMDHPVIPDDMVAYRMCETAVTFGQLRTARRVLWAGRAYLAEWHRQQQESGNG